MTLTDASVTVAMPSLFQTNCSSLMANINDLSPSADRIVLLVIAADPFVPTKVTSATAPVEWRFVICTLWTSPMFLPRFTISWVSSSIV